MNWLFGMTFSAVFALPALLAAEGDPLPMLAQWGIAAPLMAGLWWTYRREANRADRLEEKLLEAFPLIAQATLALNDSNEVLRDLAHKDRR